MDPYVWPLSEHGFKQGPTPADDRHTAPLPYTPESAGDRFIAPVAVAEPSAGLHPTARAWKPCGLAGHTCGGRMALAYGLKRRGRPEEGLIVLEEALALAGTDREQPWYDAELYRLRGELLLTATGQGPQSRVPKGRGSSVRSRESEAVACFQKAIDMARRQEAKSLELRATISLARLWQQQGRRDEARALLAPIYGWFTEGFDTADLQEARTLLEELS